MTILSSTDFMRKNNFKNEAMIESELQRVYNDPKNPEKYNQTKDL